MLFRMPPPQSADLEAGRAHVTTPNGAFESIHHLEWEFRSSGRVYSSGDGCGGKQVCGVERSELVLSPLSRLQAVHRPTFDRPLGNMARYLPSAYLNRSCR